MSIIHSPTYEDWQRLSQLVQLQRAVRNSTCLKRTVVCALFSAEGDLLSIRSNSCAPPETGCSRIGVTSVREGYSNTCPSTHAEIAALRGIWRPHDNKPHTAFVMGHEFICKPCELALRQAGVQHIVIFGDCRALGCGEQETAHGTG